MTNIFHQAYCWCFKLFSEVFTYFIKSEFPFGFPCSTRTIKLNISQFVRCSFIFSREFWHLWQGLVTLHYRHQEKMLQNYICDKFSFDNVEWLFWIFEKNLYLSIWDISVGESFLFFLESLICLYWQKHFARIKGLYN